MDIFIVPKMLFIRITTLNLSNEFNDVLFLTLKCYYIHIFIALELDILCMITIPIDLDEETLGKVDALVKKGLYINRTEALGDDIKKGFDII